MKRIIGRKVLVTGGAAGLGLALSKLLAENGATPIVCGRREASLEAARREVPGMDIVQCDLAQASERDALTDYLGKVHPDLSIVIHNAAIMQSLSFGTGPVATEKIEQELAVNLAAPIDLTSKLLPGLLRQPRANIVFVTSGLARVPKKSTPVYCAAKAGLANFARTLSYQLEGTQVRVSEAIPALIKTAMTDGRETEKLMPPEAVAKRIVKGLNKGEREIRVGQIKMLYPVHRLAPRLAYGLLKDN